MNFAICDVQNIFFVMPTKIMEFDINL